MFGQAGATQAIKYQTRIYRGARLLGIFFAILKPQNGERIGRGFRGNFLSKSNQDVS